MPRPVTDRNPQSEGAAAGAGLRQSADAALMVRPAAFGWNPQTAGSNAFQQPVAGPVDDLRQRALSEFDALAAALAAAGVSAFALDVERNTGAP